MAELRRWTTEANERFSVVSKHIFRCNLTPQVFMLDSCRNKSVWLNQMLRRFFASHD